MGGDRDLERGGPVSRFSLCHCPRIRSPEYKLLFQCTGPSSVGALLQSNMDAESKAALFSDTIIAPARFAQANRRMTDKNEVKRKQCNCRNSRCLKLYCECFASGQYCFACNCQGCHNNPENDDKRRKAIDSTLERCM